MDVKQNLSLQEAFTQTIDPANRKALGQFFAGFKARLVDSHLPRVAISTVAEDKILFGYLIALGDLITALEAEPEGELPVKDSEDGELL